MDLLSNFLSILQEGSRRGELVVCVPHTKLNKSVTLKLLEEQYIRGYRCSYRYLFVFLKYYKGVGVLLELKQISKRSRRVYYSKNKLLRSILKGDNLIYSSSKGIQSNVSIVKNNFCEGGEVLFKVKLNYEC